MPKFLDSLLSIVQPRVRPTQTVGVGGTAVHSGYVEDPELNPKLRGRERYRTYDQILANVSIVSAGTRFFLGLVGRAAWKFEPAEGAGGKEIAEFVEDAAYDMTTPWSRVIRRSAMYRFKGFSVQEWTAKKREDGKIGFLDVEHRPQITIERWELDSSGTVHGVVQRSPQTFEEIYIPRSKLVYVVDDSLTDSPEGLGLFRHCVDAASRLQRFEYLEGISFETDLRGIPIGRAPFALLQKAVKDNLLSEADRLKAEQALKAFISGHVKNPELGLLLDSAPYFSQDEGSTPSGSMQWGMELLRGEGGPQEPVGAAIERLNREIARVLGVEGLLLGDSSEGSHALSKDKSANFSMLIDSTLEELSQVFQKDFVETLLELNGIDKKLAPTLKPDKVQFREVEQITGALSELAKAGGVMPPDDPAINEVRDMLGLSRLDLEALAEEAEARREAELAVMNAKSKPPEGGEQSSKKEE